MNGDIEKYLIDSITDFIKLCNWSMDNGQCNILPYCTVGYC